jgi:hypothetical protein
MTAQQQVVDYTRISDDAAILCRRRDFPRAVNVLQRRDPDRRRWRQAFRSLAVAGDRGLEGSRRRWFEGAIQELVLGVPDTTLRRELALDAVEYDTTWDFAEALPCWSARDLWNLAESVQLPMSYLAQVTTLPRSIRETIHTARVVVDCRRTAEAHRALALELSQSLSPTAMIEEARGSADARTLEALAGVRSQQDAARRWRELGHRLLSPVG